MSWETFCQIIRAFILFLGSISPIEFSVIMTWIKLIRLNSDKININHGQGFVFKQHIRVEMLNNELNRSKLKVFMWIFCSRSRDLHVRKWQIYSNDLKKLPQNAEKLDINGWQYQFALLKKLFTYLVCLSLILLNKTRLFYDKLSTDALFAFNTCFWSSRCPTPPSLEEYSFPAVFKFCSSLSIFHNNFSIFNICRKIYTVIITIFEKRD